MRKISPSITQLDRYMQFRAGIEGVAYSLTPDFLQASFDRGARSFFGVRVTRTTIVRDEQNPDALTAWKERH